MASQEKVVELTEHLIETLKKCGGNLDWGDPFVRADSIFDVTLDGQFNLYKAVEAALEATGL